MTNTNPELNPSRIMEIALGFWPAKTLLSAVDMDLFSILGEGSMTGEELGSRLGLHSRAVYDFLDGLVALHILERDGEGPEGRYRNGAEAAAFLDEKSPQYAGGFLKMVDARLYPSWGHLTEALRTGAPQNEMKQTGQGLFESLYSDPARQEQFLLGMAGNTAGAAFALAAQYDFSRYQTVCDVGGATGQLCIALAIRYPHLRCTSFDLPAVARIAERTIDAAGVSDRVTVASGDFFADPLPRADVITMGRILHDWDLDNKMHLITAAYDALPEGGAFIVMESLIDDARRESVFGLMSSLNMLIETGGGFDFSGRDFVNWTREVGFREAEVLPLLGPNSAAIAYK